MRRKTYVTGLFKKEMGYADATSCQVIDPIIVNMRAPRRPVLKRPCTPSDTPKRFGSPSGMETLVTRATKNMHDTTESCRPIMNPGRLLPAPLKSRSQVILANLESPRSDAWSLATAKNAICIPSSIPTVHRRRIKITKVMIGGTPSHIVVRSVKIQTRVTVQQYPRTARDMRQRAQKKTFAPALRGSSLLIISWPDSAQTIICTR
mmetsp:Transcript_30101/g.59575  ORF Transcript_30101/g.59575 Transcript_30101/m.59575 type:complete len:206 (-) Transcript_30101:768-1385(-)